MSNVISVSVLADVRDIRSKLGSLDKQVTGFGTNVKRVGGLIVGAFAGGVVFQGITKVVTAASDFNETVSKTDAIFGKSSESVKQWADDAATSLGLSKQAALDGVTVFGNYYNQLGFTNKETEKLSKNLVVAAVDLASFSNADPTEVMNAMASATRGEYDALQKYIPTINAATVEKEALRASGKASVKDLTEEDKARAVNTLVMKEQGKAAGDFERTQGSLANQTKILKANFDNFVITLGEFLLPAVTAIATYITTNMVPVFKTIGEYIKSTIVPAFKEFGTFLLDNKDYLIAIGAALGVIGTALLAYTIYQKAAAAATAAWAVVQAILNGALLANPLGLIIGAIALVVGALVLAYQKSETFRKIVDKVWGFIKSITEAVFPVIVEVIKTAFEFIWNAISTYVRLYIAVIKKAWEIISTVTKAVWNFVKNYIINPIKAAYAFIKTAVGQIKTNIQNAWNTLKNITTTIWNGIKNAISNSITNFMANVRAIKDKILSAFSGANTWLIDMGKNIITGLINGVKAMAQNLINAVTGVVGDAIEGAKNLLGISSPSRVFIEIGKQTTEGLAIGLADYNANKKVQQAAGVMTTSIGKGFESPALSLDVTGSGTGMGTTVNVTVNVPATANPVETGRAVANALDAYYKSGGRRLAI